MKEFTIKCDNKKEAEFIVQYFLNKGCTMDCEELADLNNCKFEKPVVIFNLWESPLSLYFGDNAAYFNTYSITITEAKHIMRQEKLKRIQ